MVEECPLLLPYLKLAAMSQKPENFSRDPSSEDMSTVEGIERDVRVGIAGFTVRPEQHSKIGVCPTCSRNVFDPHVQVQEMYLSMFTLLHYHGVGGIFLRVVPSPVQADVRIGLSDGRSELAKSSGNLDH